MATSSSDWLVHQLWPPPGGKQRTGLDVVFFHGPQLSANDTSDAWCSTWTQRGHEDVCWPQEWLPNDLGQAVRIFSISYNAHVLNSPHGHISEIAHNLFLILMTGRYEWDHPIVLVGHSFGGLVLKSLVVKLKTILATANATDPLSKAIVQCVRVFLSNLKGVAFYSVPHAGSSNIAKYVNKLLGYNNRHHPGIMDNIQPWQGDMEQLSEDFDRIVTENEINIYGFCEGRPMEQMGILVDSISAQRSAGANFYKVEDANHMEVCKPPNKEHPSYSLLLQFIITCGKVSELQFIPQDSLPTVVSQHHSEANEKQGSNNKDNAAKRKHSARKERKLNIGSDGPKNRTEEHQAKQEVQIKEAGMVAMSRLGRFLPRDSVPAVGSQNHSEADEKRGSNNKDDAAKQKHSARKEQKSEHRVKRKKHRKSRKGEESSEGSSDDDDDDDSGSDGPKNRTEEHQAKQEVQIKEAGMVTMSRLGRFLPRDSVPAVVLQNHSEADEKRGSNNKDDAAKQKHSARKEWKSEHRVKRKKHRKSRKGEESSKGSSDDDDNNDGSSDGPKNSTEEHQAKQEVRRKEAGLEWMTQAPERPAPVVVESEDVYTLEGEKPQSSVKELNPYWKSAGNGLPSEGDTGGLQKVGRSGLPPPPGVGDGGASWRLKALKRAQEQAAREGRQLDEVVEERWGSLAALTTSVAVQRAAHANSHMHAKRDRRRTSQGHDVSEGVGKADAPAEPEDEDDRRIRTSSRDYLHEVKVEGSRMKAPQADRSLSWKSKGRGGKPGMRPEDAAVFRAAAVTYNKFNDDGSFFKGLNLKSAQEEKVDLGAQISAVDETPRIVEAGAVLKRESEEAPVTEHLTRTSRIEVESDKRTESSGVQLQGLSTNQMAAKVMRLRLQGKHKEAEELLKQSESAANREKELFADAPAEEPTSRPLGVLARLEVLGQKTILSRRKTADRDLAETISRNKLYKADDEYDDYGPAAGKKQKKSAGTRETVATQGRNRIVTQHERCQWCFDNAERPKHLTIALANFTYLTLSPRRQIVPSHCFIVPMQHEGATRNVDEAVWEELRNFKKCLVRMFSEQEKEVIFLETAMHLSHMRHHCVVECIPIPASFAKEAPLYFKKAIEEAESEWSQHNSKKLIDTTGKGLRACIPKNFPYFHVEFGLNAGYVHVIDDEASFKPQFGADVIRGMLETEGIEMHGQSASLKQQQQAVRDFTKMWEPHDWTKMLD